MQPQPVAGDSPPTARPRGRPRDPEKMRSVLEAAQREFTHRGFEGASLDAIARASGVSKVTIYSYFPSKDALYEAAVLSRVEGPGGLEDLGPLDPRHPREALTRIGTRFLALIRSPDVLAHHRMVYGAAMQRSAASKGFFEGGPLRTTALVTEYLKAAHKAGTLAVPDAALAADQFVALFLGNAHIAGMLGLKAASPAEDKKLLKANVQLFLRGYAPAPAA